MKKLTSIFFGLTALSLVSFINPATGIESGTVISVPGSKKAKGTVYKVDSQQSKLVWTGKKVTGEHTGLAPISGGNVVTEGGKLTGGSFEIDLKSLTVTDLTDPEANGKLVGHLKADDYFSVATYPTAKFAITKVQPTTSGNVDITGDLTIKGITNPVTFPAKVTTANDKLTATARITLDRTKYNIKFRSKSFFENLGDKTIYDDFTLDVTLVATPGTVASAKTGH